MIVQTVHALNNTSSILWEKLDFWEFVLIAISIFVLAAGIFSIVFILWWGLLLILSWGKDDKIKSFYLNNSKLKKRIKIKIDINHLKKECLKLSKKLFLKKNW